MKLSIQRIVYIIFIVTFGIIIFYIIKVDINYRNQLKDLRKNEISGKIDSIKDLGRGKYSLTLNDDIKLPGLRIRNEIEDYNLKVGDSLYKPENSKIITFFNYKEGKYIKCCYHDIGP